MPLRRGYETKEERKAAVKETPEPLKFEDVPVVHWDICYPNGVVSVVIHPDETGYFVEDTNTLDVVRKGTRQIYNLSKAYWYDIREYTIKVPEKKFVPTLALGGADPQAAT